MTETDNKDADLRQQAVDDIRQMYPPIMTTAHVADLLHCSIGDVRDKVHRGELPAVRWGQQFRFFRDELLAALAAGVGDEEPVAHE